MRLRDTGLAFSLVTLILHWVSAAALAGVAVLECLAISDPTRRFALEPKINGLGALLVLTAAYRLWARLTSHHPLPVGAPHPIEVIISRSVAFGLLLATLLLPLAAWAYWSAAGMPIRMPGEYVLPPLMAAKPAAAKVLLALFRVGFGAFLVGLALHVFGAMKNHFVLGNDTLRRMLGKRVEL